MTQNAPILLYFFGSLRTGNYASKRNFNPQWKKDIFCCIREYFDCNLCVKFLLYLYQLAQAELLKVCNPRIEQNYWRKCFSSLKWLENEELANCEFIVCSFQDWGSSPCAELLRRQNGRRVSRELLLSYG